jgi:hypothetical protein
LGHEGKFVGFRMNIGKRRRKRLHESRGGGGSVQAKYLSLKCLLSPYIRWPNMGSFLGIRERHMH